MPARKNRPDKHGSPRAASHTFQLEEAVRRLALKLVLCEKKEPKCDHYVGWPDMAAAEEMQRRGLLREGQLARGCFYITDKFRELYANELR